MNLIIHSSFDHLYQQLSLLTSYKRWKLATASICTFISIFLHNPDYLSLYSTTPYHLEFSDYRSNWETIFQQSQHPLTPQHHSGNTHRSKRTFRLVPALIGNIFSYNGLDSFIAGLFLLQHLLGFIFYYLFINLICQLSGQKVYALILTLGLPFIYLGNAFFWDTYGWFDGIAFFSLLCTIYALIKNKLWLVAFFLSLAFWTDERSITVSPAIFFWIPFIHKRDNIKSIQLLKRVALVYIITLLVYALVRALLGLYFKLYVPMGTDSLVGIEVLLINMPLMPYSMLNTFDGYWILFISSFLWLRKNFSKRYAIASMIFFAFSWIISYSVLDVTRSLSYVFIWILLAIVIVGKNTESRLATALALVVTTSSFISPTLFFIGKSSFPLFNFHQIKVIGSQLLFHF